MNPATATITASGTAPDTPTALYADRRRLYALAYRMLGSAGDAEDIVQEAFLRWHAQPRADVREPRAFLTTVVTRLCLDHIKSARVRLETYPGVWLPEPAVSGAADGGSADEARAEAAGTPPAASHVTPEAELERLESVSLAFLAVLQTLSPIERAVYLLTEIFDYSHAEAGDLLGRTPAACRQALHRARTALAAGVRGEPPSASHHALLASFLMATRSGDLEGLTRMLADDVESRADGGGYVSAATKPVFGLRAVSRLYAGLAAQIPQSVQARIVDLHGWPTALLYQDEVLLAALQIQAAHDRIQRIDNVMNPEKLLRLARSLGLKTSLPG
ncbi:sigma-70 family RNA polymerase sigma factor [Massilia arenosa]|uniref:Sigma-70 family RNA polymerase sigma factor n=1 Tax=Zemynaea arenosa TaxID=2561931 RepID=A0A4Y9RR79_9BURK|nr:sigma-70 family RNA polymerase sigma factor [Massilia arenosa]TFW11393.1 sigma-70 family RNA polymerase sigma factor [Massilia arenosa]